MRKDSKLNRWARALLAGALIAAAARSTGAAELAKVKIIALEGSAGEVTAQFNPAEIKIEKQVPWERHKAAEGESAILKFSDAGSRTLSLELLFDGYGTSTNVQTEWIAKLEKLASIDEAKQRPPMCMFTWGVQLPPFRGVIENLAVRYTLFLADGTPVRAAAHVTIREAGAVRVKGGAFPFKPTPCDVSPECPVGQVCVVDTCAPPAP